MLVSCCIQPETRYKGLPKYMNEEVNPWWPKVDCSDVMSNGSGYAPWIIEKMKSDPKVSVWA